MKVRSLLCLTLPAALCLAERLPLEQLDVMTAGYPRAYFFRFSEGMAANPKVTYEDWEKAFQRLMGIEGKVLDEEVPGRSKRNIEFFTRFKERHPRQLVLLHYNGNARDPRDAAHFFAGHWIYHNGARILGDIPAEAGETEIRVSDARLFRVNIGRYKNSNEDIGLCELDASGRPNWRASEQVRLLSADAARGVIRVRRGQYGTVPRAFAAGKAYAAAHVTEGPWGEKSELLWFYNHSTLCPADAKGRRADDVLLDEIAGWFAPGGRLAAFDGIQFDVLKHRPGGGSSAARGPDVDADGAADAGLVNGANVYGNGVIQFCRRLTARLGRQRLVLADGWNDRDQRAFGILNGIESEGWPSLRDHEVKDWSGGLNRQSFWMANSRDPSFSYINHKYNVDGNTSPEIPYNIHRLVFAGAVFTGSAICFSLRPPAGPGEVVGVWDELWMGAERWLGWLGQPLGPAVQMAARAPNLLDGRDPAALIRTKTARIRAGRTLDVEDPGAPQTVFRLTGLPPGELFVSFTARSGPPAQGPAEAGRELRVGKSFAWVNERPFAYSFYLPDANGEVEFRVEGGDLLSVSDLAVRRHAAAMYREFENGLVLANPSPRPYTFPLAQLFPGKQFRRLRGSANQDPAVNDGSAAPPSLQLGPKDALFLVTVR